MSQAANCSALRRWGHCLKRWRALAGRLSLGWGLWLCAWLGMWSVAVAQPLGPVTPPAPLAQAALDSPRLALIRARGQLIVGVKTDYPPFGQLDAAGRSEGLEHDLAADLARRLGVQLSKVAVTGANRLQKLEEGSIDVVLATLGDTADRRRIATLIEPNYYASGVTLLMPPELHVRDWSELRGRSVCATQGSYFNRSMAQRYLLNLQMYNSGRDAKLAVRDRRCAGYLFDNTAIAGDLRRPEWAGYHAPLPVVLPTPWALAIARSERGLGFERWLGDVVADWHRSGFLIERERAWGLPASDFLQQTRALWRREVFKGEPLCQRQTDGQWPSACRNQVFLSSSDVGGLHRLGLWVKEQSGLDFTFVYDGYDRSRFLRGLLTTLALMLASVALSLLMGVVGALVVEARWPVWSAAMHAASTVGRMTPPLLVMYLLVFGLGSQLAQSVGWQLPPGVVVVACLGFYTGSSVLVALLFAADVQRHSDPAYRLRRDNLRALVAQSSGHITAALVNVSKATMMASAFAVPELMSAVTTIMTDNGNVALMMNVLLLVFLALIFVTFRALGWIERRFMQAPLRRRGTA